MGEAAPHTSPVSDPTGGFAPAATIVCVECGGTCHRLGDDPEMGWQPGDIVVYRCADCWDRFDTVLDDPEPGAGH